MSEPKQNPYRSGNTGWYWRDEKNVAHGPYLSQTAALRHLLNHVDPIGWWKHECLAFIACGLAGFVLGQIVVRFL